MRSQFALNFVFIVAFGLLALSTASGHAKEQAGSKFDYSRVAKAALEHHIRPGFAALTKAFKDLESATGQCVSDKKFDFLKLRPAFREAVVAWGQVAHLSFGPMVDEHRYERIFFWLDRKGIARKQVARALRAKTPGYLDPTDLGGRSVGVQGLPAFENLMMRAPKAGEDRSFRCGYLKAIAANLVKISQDAEADWSKSGIWAKRWLHPGEGDSIYLKPRETIYALIRAYLDNVEKVRDIELSRPLGFARRGKFLPGPFDRSDLTMVFLDARISGLRALVEQSELVDEIERVAEEKNNDDASGAIKQVLFELNLLDTEAEKLSKISKFFRSKEKRQAIAFGYQLKSARSSMEFAVSLTTDLPMGFNASDGD